MDFVAIDLETANEKRSSAAANILINIAKELNLDKIEDISKIIGFKWGSRFNNNWWRKIRRNFKRKIVNHEYYFK